VPDDEKSEVSGRTLLTSDLIHLVACRDQSDELRCGSELVQARLTFLSDSLELTKDERRAVPASTVE
jgi:hypothetical protein